MLTKPLCIVGAARSGTTLLCRLLSQHPDTAVWNEPKYLWQYRKPTTFHDMRTAEEATPEVQRYIRSRLANYVEQKEGRRLVEKTPSNCFRIPFVYEVLPEARFIHVIRDGRDVAFSACAQWGLINEDIGETHEEGLTHRLFRYAWRRIRSNDIPVVDMPFYAVQFLKRILKRMVPGESASEASVWGPKFPGIRETAKANDVLETCAIQWRESVRAAYEGLRVVPEDQKLEVRFEHLVRNPVGEVRAIFDFGELTEQESCLREIENVVSSDAADRWRGRDAEEVRRVMETVGDLVHELEASR